MACYIFPLPLLVLSAVSKSLQSPPNVNMTRMVSGFLLLFLAFNLASKFLTTLLSISVTLTRETFVLLQSQNVFLDRNRSFMIHLCLCFIKLCLCKI